MLVFYKRRGTHQKIWSIDVFSCSDPIFRRMLTSCRLLFNLHYWRLFETRSLSPFSRYSIEPTWKTLKSVFLPIFPNVIFLPFLLMKITVVILLFLEAWSGHGNLYLELWRLWVVVTLLVKSGLQTLLKIMPLLPPKKCLWGFNDCFWVCTCAIKMCLKWT